MKLRILTYFLEFNYYDYNHKTFGQQVIELNIRDYFNLKKAEL